MPNGDRNFHFEGKTQLDALFEPLAHALVEFGHAHNLRLEKYYHQAPCWEFTFRHPEGGIGKIQICSDNGESVRAYCHWWYDEYSAQTRFMKTFEGEAMACDPQIVSFELVRLLRMMLSWRFGNWDESRPGYDVWTRNWTKEQFERLQEAYPIPKV